VQRTKVHEWGDVVILEIFCLSEINSFGGRKLQQGKYI
jgi:hypothetical protein